jgi:hypothetical protein
MQQDTANQIVQNYDKEKSQKSSKRGEGGGGRQEEEMTQITMYAHVNK